MKGPLIHVVNSVADEAAGPSYSIPRLCAALAASGHDVHLMTTDGQPLEVQGWRHEVFPPNFTKTPIVSRLRLSRSLASALNHAAQKAALFHSHGLWLMPNIYPARTSVRTGKPLVLSPRGMLGSAALQFSPKRKQLFWTLLQRNATDAARCIHVTSRQEYDDVRTFGLKGPVAIIPNGIDVPSIPSPARRKDGQRILLYLGRLHPKKGLDSLIRAWARIENRYPDWVLHIAGPLRGFSASELERLSSVLQLRNLKFIGPVYGVEKSATYAAADLFILPTRNENFGLVVAEALSCGTPVICTRGAPWSGLETNRCGWWIEEGVESLVAALEKALALSSDELSVMGEAGRKWMQREFEWSVIAAAMTDLYSWLIGHGDCPSCVITD